MKPKAQTEHDTGLLEYLEDIIGSNKYIDDIDAAVAKVQELNDGRQEKLNRVKAVEKEMQSLKGAKVEAELYISKEKELIAKKHMICQLDAAEARKTADGIRAKHAELMSAMDEQRAKAEEIKSKIEETSSLFEEAKGEHDTIVAELKKSKKDFAAFERKDIKHREDLKHVKSTNKKLKVTSGKEAKKIEKYNVLAEKLAEEIPKLKAVVEAQEKKRNQPSRSLMPYMRL